MQNFTEFTAVRVNYRRFPVTVRQSLIVVLFVYALFPWSRKFDVRLTGLFKDYLLTYLLAMAWRSELYIRIYGSGGD